MREGLLLLPSDRVDASFREGFWRWISLLAEGDFQAAVEALRWGEGTEMSPGQLEERIAAFFNDSDVMVPIVPNERLVAMIDEKMEIEWDEEDGWAMALLPVSNEPDKAKDDNVALMGIAISFFVVKQGGHQVLEFEKFHV